MKKKFKKLLTSLLALAMVLSSFTIPTANVQAAEETATTAYLSFADSAWTVQYWMDGNDYAPVVATNADVTGFGQYTVALDFTGVDGGVAPDMGFFDVEIKDGEALYPNSFMTIDSVKINGEEVELGKTYTSTDDKIATRTNLFNTWVTEVTGGRTVDGDSTDVSAAPIGTDVVTNISTLEVTFTLGEGVAFGDALVSEEVVEEEYVMPTEFNAFMMFSDASAAWESYAPGTPGDATILGDGTYTVFLKASDIGATGQATEGAVFLVDIEGLGDAMKSVGTLRADANDAFIDTDASAKVQVFVDGVEVIAKSDNILMGDLEGNGRLRLELYNIYGSGTADLPVVMPDVLTPADEIKVVFTLTGTGINTGAAVEEVEEVEVVEEATTVTVEEDSDSGLSTGVIAGIVIAVVVVAGAICVVVMKKKKATK